MKGIPDPLGTARKRYRLESLEDILKIRGAKVVLASLYFFLRRENLFEEVQEFILQILPLEYVKEEEL